MAIKRTNIGEIEKITRDAFGFCEERKKEERKKGKNEAIGSARKVASRKGCPPDLMQPRFNDRASRKQGGGGKGGMEKALEGVHVYRRQLYRKVPSKRNDEKGQLASIISLSADL